MYRFGMFNAAVGNIKKDPELEEAVWDFCLKNIRCANLLEDKANSSSSSMQSLYFRKCATIIDEINQMAFCVLRYGSVRFDITVFENRTTLGNYLLAAFEGFKEAKMLELMNILKMFDNFRAAFNHALLVSEDVKHDPFVRKEVMHGVGEPLFQQLKDVFLEVAHGYLDKDVFVKLETIIKSLSRFDDKLQNN
jgi:hypothetical protein